MERARRSVDFSGADFAAADAAGFVQGAPGPARLEERRQAAVGAEGYVQALLELCLHRWVSDVHLERHSGALQVRVRAEGQLEEYPPPPVSLAANVVAHLKMRGGLRLDEFRVPQDGRFSFQKSGGELDIRIATLPSEKGESVVLRTLGRANLASWAELGMDEIAARAFSTLVHRPQGIVVVAGPTGAGKTTTLNIALRELAGEGRKVVAAEDPVEYVVPGVVQSSIQPERGYTFAAALRAFLRHDPDVLLVGELRDRETTEVAVQGALTGHLLLTTLHAEDSIGVLARLLDLGVERSWLMQALEGILAQRLLRRLRPEAREAYTPTFEECAELRRAGLPEGGPLYRSRLGDEGFSGRFGVFEVLPVDEALRAQVLRDTSLPALRAKCKGKIQRLRRYALAAALAGETSFSEAVEKTPAG